MSIEVLVNGKSKIFDVDDLGCVLYPMVYALQNGGYLDYGNEMAACLPPNARMEAG